MLRFIIECTTTEEEVLGLTFYMELCMIIIMQALVASVGDTCSNGLIIKKKSCLRVYESCMHDFIAHVSFQTEL